MKNKYIIRNFIFTFIILVFIILYTFLSHNKNYKKMYLKYQPDYTDKYQEILSSYELLSDNYIFIPAQILKISNFKINNLFFINKGTDDNIVENSFVVNYDGLVGIVKKTFKKFSVVQLITSKNVSISVEINDCYGTLRNSNNQSYVEDLINCQNVNVNDPVFTSKYSKSSSNILIGHVKDIKDNKIYISYSFNPYKLKYFGVIYDNY